MRQFGLHGPSYALNFVSVASGSHLVGYKIILLRPLLLTPAKNVINNSSRPAGISETPGSNPGLTSKFLGGTRASNPTLRFSGCPIIWVRTSRLVGSKRGHRRIKRIPQRYGGGTELT